MLIKDQFDALPYYQSIYWAIVIIDYLIFSVAAGDNAEEFLWLI